MDLHPSSSRRTAVVAGLIVIAIAAVGTVYMINRSGGHRNESGADQTAWQQVMSGTTESGETTVAVARQAFSLTFEPLPGVEVPAGSRSDIQSGSAALRLMIAHWSELTADEQNVVLSYLPAGEGGTAPGAGLDTLGLQTVGLVQTVGFAPPGAAQFTARSSVAAAGNGPDDATKQLIASRVDALRTALGSHAGRVLEGVVDLSYNIGEIEVGSAAYTLPHSAKQLVTHPTPNTASLSQPIGTYTGCFIAFNPDGWQSRGTNLDFVIAHELYHCFEGMFIGDLNVFYDKASAPSWVIEGGANWAAAQVVPTSHRASGAWQDYLLVPSTPLFQQSYDAIGFWNHLEEVSAIDTWGALRNALGKSSAAALAQTDGGSDAFLDSWASSLFRQPQFGINWQTDGPTMSSLRFTPEEVTIANGSRVSRTAFPYGKTLLYSDIASDVVVIVGVGHVSMHNAAHDESQFGQLVYCAREQGCGCPPGSVNIAPTPAPLDGRILAFGVTGSARAAAVALGGFSLDDWCKKADPPISKRPSNDSGAGAGNGDGTGSLCHQILEREGIDGLLSHPSMTPQDIQDCVAEILANSGFPGG